MTEFYHHGVKGQKWGVRRYRNKDGTLTKLGKKRMAEAYDELKKKLDDANVPETEKATKLNKGTILYRVTDTEKEDMSKSMYVTPSWKDHMDYMEQADMLLLDLTKGLYSQELKTIKDITIADGKDVVNHIVEKYGSEKVKDVQKHINDLNANYKTHDMSEILERNKITNKDGSVTYTPKKNKTWAEQEITDALNERDKLIIKTTLNAKTRSEIVKHFARKGYDAITDPEDGMYYGYDTPIILLNPKRSAKLHRTIDWSNP